MIVEMTINWIYGKSTKVQKLNHRRVRERERVLFVERDESFSAQERKKEGKANVYIGLAVLPAMSFRGILRCDSEVNTYLYLYVYI